MRAGTILDDWALALRGGGDGERDALVFTSPTEGERVISFEQVAPRPGYLAAGRMYVEHARHHMTLLLDTERLSVHGTDETCRGPERNQHLLAMALPRLLDPAVAGALEAQATAVLESAVCWVRRPFDLRAAGGGWLIWMGMDGHPIVDVPRGRTVVLVPPSPVPLEDAWEAEPSTTFLVARGGTLAPLGYLRVVAPGAVLLVPWTAACRVLELVLEGVRPARGRALSLADALPPGWL